MQKLIVVVLMIFLSMCSSFANETTLMGYVEKVPDTFFGTWRVSSMRLDTDSPMNFNEKGLDIWNLSVENGVISLSNPFSGACAEISVEYASGNTVNFTRIGKYDNKILTDKVNIDIQEDKFIGRNEIKLDTISDIDGSIRKTVTAIYSIRGEKIAGQSVIRN